MQQQGLGATWRGSAASLPNLTGPSRHTAQRQPFNAPADRSFRSHTSISEQSDGSANEVENLLNGMGMRRPGTNATATGPTWSVPRRHKDRTNPRNAGVHNLR